MNVSGKADNVAKRSSKGRRREPIRRSIPAARLSAPRTEPRTDLTPRHLAGGWPLDGGVRVRLAEPADMSAVCELVALAGVALEPEVVQAVDRGIAAAALRAAITGGREAFTRHMAEQFIAHQGGDISMAFQHVTLVLVAEHDERGVIGAAVTYPPIAVIKQLMAYGQRAGARPQQAMEILGSGALAIARIKALAVAEDLRDSGIGSALLHRSWQIFDHSGYMIVYGQAADSPALQRFYRRHHFEVLEPGAGFDPWVVFGIHADIRPDPGERTFIRHRPSESERRRQRPVPGPRRPSRYDPGTLALHDAHLPYLLERGSGEQLATHFLPLLWVKLAEGRRANSCVDACATLFHAFGQFGIEAEILPTGVVVHDGDGQRTQFATDRPHWSTDTEFVGHAVLVLPQLGKLIDPTVEQVPPIRALGMGPVIGRIPPEGRDALRHGGASFGIPREELLIEYVPVHAEHLSVLTEAPLMAANAEAHRRSGINLATLALSALRADDVVDRIRQAPFPGIHALLDAVGNAPIEPDGAGDMRIALTDDTGATVNMRLDDLTSPPATPARPPRTWWGGRRER